eukprot:m.310343 g.310343  ORF g.310343 m.310343 type:complete len:106 (+) comp50990_c0_seq1:986-1303(+)
MTTRNLTLIFIVFPEENWQAMLAHGTQCVELLMKITLSMWSLLLFPAHLDCSFSLKFCTLQWMERKRERRRCNEAMGRLIVVDGSVECMLGVCLKHGILALTFLC